MNKYISVLHLLLLVLLVPLGCGSGNGNYPLDGGDDSALEPNGNFDSYWYQGAAEISSYTLTQARYGQMHEGKAVFVYVTEDFSEKDHHKINDPVAKADELVPILKLNMTKDFNTGIYPYSLMKSVFSPVNVDQYPHALRVTGSMQEWCGHAFTQIDREGKGWKGMLYSYFESEGDHPIELEDAWLEDELWVLLRIAPEKLPVGDFDLIPSVYYNRLSHRPFAVEKAMGKMEKQGENNVYTVTYKEFGRELVITFASTFPYQVQRWTDTYRSGWGPKAKELTTVGELDETIMLDYWNKNSPADLEYRKKLNLD